jgi:hypothetical protein
MKFTSLAKTAVATVVLSTAAIGANAATGTIYAAPAGASFTDLVVGSIYVSELSDLTGNLFGASSVSYGPFTLTLGTVTFTSASVGALVGDLDATAAGFSFKNVAIGNYIVKATGSVSGGQLPGVSLVAANYTVTAVPEPETYAMLLAGLGLMGTIARRRAQKEAA